MSDGGKIRQLPPSRQAVRHPSVRAGRDLPPERDPMGKMALFSGEGRPSVTGTFLVDCSACRRETPVSAVQLIRATLPFSLHLPLLRRYHSFMRCPACGRRTWVRVRWQV